MKTKTLLCGIALSLLTIGCSENDATDNTTMSTGEVGMNVKTDIAFDKIANMIEEQLNAIETDNTGTTAKTADSNRPECATITRVPPIGTALIPGQIVTQTTDYGTSGCTVGSNILKGKVIYSFVYNPGVVQSGSYSLADYYNDGTKMDGNSTFVRRMTSGANAHPITTFNMDHNVTFSNGKAYHEVGKRIREMIEGFETVSSTDNVFQVTGTSTVTYSDGNQEVSTITFPLIIKSNCGTNFPVQGVVTTVKNGSSTSSIDYGDGTCDNIVIITINGVSHTVGN